MFHGCIEPEFSYNYYRGIAVLTFRTPPIETAGNGKQGFARITGKLTQALKTCRWPRRAV